MNNNFPNLFTPIKVRNYTYKNRIINAPTLFAHSVLFLPEIKENVYRMVENRAKGGSAAVSTGEISVNAEEALCLFLERPVDFTKYEGDDFEAIKEFATRIKKHGAISYLEFCHEGSRSEAKPPYQPWGPDGYVREDGVEVKAMDLSMMKKVCDDFAKVSRFAKECGFDGVLVHGGHGFNMQQFLSPWTNHRTDDFGGSMENRARFPIMILDAVREAIGDEMIIELRISAEDGVKDGLTIDETVEFCKLIDGKADIIHVSNGLKWAGNQTNTFSDFFNEHGVNVEHAAKIKKAVKKSLVAVIGGINSPEHAEEIIACGKADFIEIGRQGFADPDFANKAQNGEADKIRRCVRCFQCYPGFCEHETDIPLWEKIPAEEAFKIYSPASMGRCAINPNSGFGHYADRMPVPKTSRNVLIIGGGVGGLQTALTAKERGHKVTLVEKTNKLGGIINFTDTDADKVDLRNFKNLLIKEVENDPDIKVIMNTEADSKLINEINADAVVIAVGSQPSVPNIPGIEKAMNALEAYNSMDKVSKKVVIVGGGLVGCEVGLHLVNEGRNVTIIEMNKMMAYETFGYYRNALLDEMDKRKINQLLGSKCLEFKDNGVLISKDGQESFVEADTVIFSMGMKSNTETVERLKKSCKDKEIYIVGDCEKPGKLGDSVRAGYMAAMSII